MTCTLHIEPDIVLFGKLYSLLNVMCFGGVDHINWILFDIAKMKNCGETSVMLPIGLLDADGIVGVEQRL